MTGGLDAAREPRCRRCGRPIAAGGCRLSRQAPRRDSQKHDEDRRRALRAGSTKRNPIDSLLCPLSVPLRSALNASLTRWPLFSASSSSRSASSSLPVSISTTARLLCASPSFGSTCSAARHSRSASAKALVRKYALPSATEIYAGCLGRSALISAAAHAFELPDLAVDLGELGRDIDPGGPDTAGLDRTPRVAQVSDLIVEPAIAFDLVGDLIGRGAMERVARREVGPHRFHVPSRRHVGLAEAVVGELEQRIQLDRRLEFTLGLVEALGLQCVLAGAQVLHRTLLGSSSVPEPAARKTIATDQRRKREQESHRGKNQKKGPAEAGRPILRQASVPTTGSGCRAGCCAAA